MPARHVQSLSFTPEQTRFVKACVLSGRYQTASEVVRAGLRLLQVHEAQTATALETARARIAEGAEQLDRGQTIDGEAVFRRLKSRHDRLSAKAKRRS